MQNHPITCAACGSTSNAVKPKGSMGTEIILWCLGILTVGVFLLLAIPYSAWRLMSKRRVCLDCGGELFAFPVPRFGGPDAGR